MKLWLSVLLIKFILTFPGTLAAVMLMIWWRCNSSKWCDRGLSTPGFQEEGLLGEVEWVVEGCVDSHGKLKMNQKDSDTHFHFS